MDFQGKVWASTIDSPTNISYNPGILEWAGVENAAYYNIFKVIDSSATSSIKNKKTIFVKKLEDSSETVTDNTLPNLKTGEQYLVSAVDGKGFESAPAGTNYGGYVEVPFTGGQSEEPQQEAIIPVGTVYTFTNAGQTDRIGPSQSQLDSAYAGTTLEGKVTSNNGIQLWTVPETGKYKIEAYGAEGGLHGLGSGGKGAIISGIVDLNANTQLKIVVGQEGLDQPSSIDGGSGGGGGSFVILSDNSPLIIAGGGGGAGDGDYAGQNASTSESGTRDSHNNLNVATSGNGGDGRDGSGGGGLLTNGHNGYGSYDDPGKAFVNGANGGYGWHNINGGFGGGGGTYNGGGGGGGYSGGAGGSYTSSLGYASGGGGGSYVISTATNVNKSVGNTGHGKVVVTKMN